LAGDPGRAGVEPVLSPRRQCHCRALGGELRGLLVELRAALASIRAESGDASGATTLLARARAEAPPADIRARRHLEAAEDAILAASPSRAVRA